MLELTYNNLYNYGPISYLLSNKNLEEISIIGTNKPVYVYHKNYGWLETNIFYISEDILKELINKLSWFSNKYITLKNQIGQQVRGKRKNNFSGLRIQSIKPFIAGLQESF